MAGAKDTKDTKDTNVTSDKPVEPVNTDEPIPTDDEGRQPHEVPPKTHGPTTQQIREERERTTNADHPQLPEAVNPHGEVLTQDDVPPADVEVDDVLALVPPPATSSYVTFPDSLRDEAPNDDHELHYHRDDDGNIEKGHWVQVVQVHTYDDGRVPLVSLRCECNREYVIDWTADMARQIVKARRS